MLRKSQVDTGSNLRNEPFNFFFKTPLNTDTTMIIMPIKEGENIERALKKFKRKYEKTGVIKELRSRQYFTKPSVKNRVQRLKAIYVQSLQREEE